MMVAAAAVCVACVAASVASCGVASPLMGVVIGVTITAAVLYATEGIAEMVEAGTEYNFVRDGFFGGNEEAYETSKIVLYTIMQVGTMIITAGSCFVAGTPVATEEGNVPIETIHAGDYVWAWDEKTGEVALKQVVETYVNESNELIHLTINGEEIVTTPTHPFYVPQKGWTSATKLRAGDILVLLNGEYAILEQVQHELLENPIQVYNFQVEDYHTYYVGGTGVLVHNSCGGETPATKYGRDMHKKWNYGLGVAKEKIIAKGARVDGIDYVNKIVYELKPDNYRAIIRGVNQLNRYLNILGDDWIGVLITYGKP